MYGNKLSIYLAAANKEPNILKVDSYIVLLIRKSSSVFHSYSKTSFYYNCVYSSIATINK